MFTDGSLKAQLGLPDMKLPIQYALSYPYRLPNAFPRFDFSKYPLFSFEAPDTSRFPCLTLAYEASKLGHNIPCAMNAANEVAVALFLQNKIKFTDIPKIIEKAIFETTPTPTSSIEDYLSTDQYWREKLQLDVW